MKIDWFPYVQAMIQTRVKAGMTIADATDEATKLLGKEVEGDMPRASWKEQSKVDWGSRYNEADGFGRDSGLIEKLQVGATMRIADALEGILAEIKGIRQCHTVNRALRSIINQQSRITKHLNQIEAKKK